MNKIIYIDISDCSIEEAYIKMGRPDLASLHRQSKLIWNIGLGIILISAIMHISLLLSKLS